METPPYNPRSPESESGEPFFLRGDQLVKDDMPSLGGDRISASEQMSDQPDAANTIEQLEKDPDWVDKLTMVPLPLATLQELLNQVATEDSLEYSDDREAATNTSVAKGDSDPYETAFKQQFISELQQVLQELMQNTQLGDSITFDDLSLAAERATGHADKVNADFARDPSAIAETMVIGKITDQFAGAFERSPKLESIADNIDAFTVHPDVHMYQRERVQDNPDQDFFSEEHGQDGRWIPERRGAMTVWVTKEQKQHNQHMAAALDAVERAYGTPQASAQEQSPENTEEGFAASEDLAKIPGTHGERVAFEKENFTGEFELAKTPLLAAFIQKELVGLAVKAREGDMRYPDTIASVVGNGGDALHYLNAVFNTQLKAQQAPPMPVKEFLALPFSEIAKVIGLDVMKIIPDYEQCFNVR